MEGRLKQISQMCLDDKKVLLGTEGGNIYQLNLTNFVIEESIIYQDLVIQHSTEEFKVNPGNIFKRSLKIILFHHFLMEFSKFFYRCC